MNYVEIPMDAITCNNRFCHEHDSAMTLFHDEIIYSCLNAGYDNIPYSNMHKVIVIPGWSDYVESKMPYFGTFCGGAIIRPDLEFLQI